MFLLLDLLKVNLTVFVFVPFLDIQIIVSISKGHAMLAAFMRELRDITETYKILALVCSSRKRVAGIALLYLVFAVIP